MKKYIALQAFASSAFVLMALPFAANAQLFTQQPQFLTQAPQPLICNFGGCYPVPPVNSPYLQQSNGIIFNMMGAYPAPLLGSETFAQQQADNQAALAIQNNFWNKQSQPPLVAPNGQPLNFRPFPTNFVAANGFIPSAQYVGPTLIPNNQYFASNVAFGGQVPPTFGQTVNFQPAPLATQPQIISTPFFTQQAPFQQQAQFQQQGGSQFPPTPTQATP